MTKYSKIKKSTFAIIALSLILVAILAFGGTYAYFSDSATAGGKVTTGKLVVSVDEDLNSESAVLKTSKVVPNESIFSGDSGKITLDFGDTDIDFYLRVKVEAKFQDEETLQQQAQGASDVEPSKALQIGTMAKFKTHTDGYAYYVGDGGEENAAVCTTSTITELPLSIIVNKEVGKNGSNVYMGKVINVSVTVEVVQAKYLDDSTTADSTFTVSDLADAWSQIVAGTYTKAA